MARPTLFPEWAASVIDEPFTNGAGDTVLVTNKVEPTSEFKSSGSLARQNLPRPYLNYQLNLINQWLEHLDSRYAVGDFHFGASSETATTINDRLGGDWADHGLDTFAGQSVRVFEKVA